MACLARENVLVGFCGVQPAANKVVIPGRSDANLHDSFAYNYIAVTWSD